MADIQRNPYPDIVKGIAILLVVMGHNIQYGAGSNMYQTEAFYDNWLYQIIYSFHMPLFIMISGYFFYGTINKYTAKEIVVSKLKSLLIPILLWSLIPFAMGLLSFDWKQENIAVALIQLLIYSTANNLWFLWGVLFNCGIVLLVNRVFKDSIFVYVLLFVGCILAPNVGKLFLYEFLYPYFVVAYLFNKYKLGDKVIRIIEQKKVAWGLGVFLFVLYAILYKFYNRESYIYTSGISIWGANGVEQIGIDIYRWMIGFIGSGFLLLLIYIFQGNVSLIDKIFMYLGKESMGIYIINIYAANSVLIWTTQSLYFSPFVLLVETIIMIAICLIAVWVIKKIPYGNRLLFGGR